MVLSCGPGFAACVLVSITNWACKPKLQVWALWLSKWVCFGVLANLCRLPVLMMGVSQ
jgi:hypothetical protein